MRDVLTKKQVAVLWRKVSGGENAQSPGSCYLCSVECREGAVQEKGKQFCIPCGASLLKGFVLPFLERTGYFSLVEAKMVSAISRVEEDERMGRTNVPLGDEEGAVDPPTWECAKCTCSNSSNHSRCEACGFPKPEPPMCALCLRDFTRFSICHYNKNKHDLWKCNNCSTQNIDSTIQCRRCRNKRTFFCPKCSSEVSPDNGLVCPKCGFEGLASSLGSLINRIELASMGLNVRDLMAEREIERSAQDNKDRLKYRIDQVCLKEVSIPDDGNCLYRALSYQLFRTDAYYACVRFLCAEYIHTHRSEFKHFVVGEDLDTVIKEMATDKTWGDELSLRAAAYALPANLHVITSDSAHWSMKYYTVSKRHLVLCYARPRHYFCAILNADVASPTIDMMGLVSDYAAQSGGDDATAEEPFGGARKASGATEEFGPKPKEALPLDAKERAALVRVAKVPSHRATLGDFGRMREPIIVTVTLGDTSTCLATSARREIVGRTVNALHFYLILLDASMVAKNIHGNFDAAQRIIKWQLPFPLFLLQRVDSVEYLTPNTLGGVDDVPFGALQRVSRASSLITNTITTDYSSALMVADESSVAGTLFKLRFVNEKLPCRYLTHLDNERVYVTDNEAASGLWSLQMPFHSEKERYCTKCSIFYRRDVKPPEGGCQHRHCLRFIRLYEDD